MGDTSQSPGLHLSSDYNITTLCIVTSDAVAIDITRLAVEINLYESLFAPCMSGTILMGDALDIVANYKLQGNEFLIMKIDKPGLNNPIDKVFRIYKISDREFKTESLQNYLIHFASEELVLSSQSYVSKSYHGMQVSDMITDVLQNKLGVQDTKINWWDDTQGNFNIIIPRMQPLEAIQWLATRGFSANGSLLMFYESRDGYNLQFYESMLQNPVYQQYTYTPKLTIRPEQNINGISFLKISQDFDILESIRYGAFSSTLLTFDFINRQMKGTVLQAGQLPLMNDNVPVNLSTNRFSTNLLGNPDSFVKFYPTTDSDPLVNPAQPQNWLHRKATRLAQLHGFKIIATIPGDVLMTAGAVIHVEIPQSLPKTAAGNQVNNLRTGLYLVSSVHHVFSNDIMMTSLELISDSVSGSLNASIDSNQDLQTIKKS